MSVTLDFLYFFALGDATERFYIFLDPQKCGNFFLNRENPFFSVNPMGDFAGFFFNLLHFAK